MRERWREMALSWSLEKAQTRDGLERGQSHRVDGVSEETPESWDQRYEVRVCLGVGHNWVFVELSEEAHDPSGRGGKVRGFVETVPEFVEELYDLRVLDVCVD